MARKVFFSFHYNKDVSRAHVVRNSWVTKEDREDAGFFDASVFESKKRISEDTLKDFLTEGLKGTSVTCVLIGSDTALRPWVRYELVRSFQRGNGLFGIHIDWIKDLSGNYATKGGNPFDYLCADRVGDKIYWKQYINAAWINYFNVPSISESSLPYSLSKEKHTIFSALFPVYCWKADDGYNNLSKWVESAATKAGK